MELAQAGCREGEGGFHRPHSPEILSRLGEADTAAAIFPARCFRRFQKPARRLLHGVFQEHGWPDCGGRHTRSAGVSLTHWRKTAPCAPAALRANIILKLA